MTDRTTRARRLEAAGYAAVVVSGKPGWVPKAYAGQVAQQVAMHAEDVAKAAAEPMRQGRPRAERIDTKP